MGGVRILWKATIGDRSVYEGALRESATDCLWHALRVMRRGSRGLIWRNDRDGSGWSLDGSLTTD